MTSSLIDKGAMRLLCPFHWNGALCLRPVSPTSSSPWKSSRQVCYAEACYPDQELWRNRQSSCLLNN